MMDVLSRCSLRLRDRSTAEGRRRDRDGGFTLIELLVVLVILSLVMGLVGPRVLGYLTDARVRSARLQIDSLSAALDLFYLDTGRYPSQSEGLEVLINRAPSLDRWNGPYLQQASLPLDPWGQPYQSEVPAAQALTRSSHWVRTVVRAAPAMPAISPAGRRSRDEQGFALVELVLALAILGLVAGIVFPRAVRAPGPAELRAAADRVAAILRTDRNAALRQRTEVLTRVDLEERVVASGSGGGSVRIPDGVRMQLLQSSREVSADGGGIRFRGEGGSSGGVIYLSRNGTGYQIAVNWLTAGVLVDAAEF